MFCIYLRTNSDLCHLQHKLIGFYNKDKKCLLRGTDWVFKYSGLCRAKALPVCNLKVAFLSFPYCHDGRKEQNVIGQPGTHFLVSM